MDVGLGASYLRWDIIDVVLPPLSSFLLSFTGEVVNILGRVTSSPQAGWDVVDLLGGLAHSAPVAMIMFGSQDRGRDVVHVLWNRRLVVIVEVAVQVLAGRDRDLLLDFGKVGGHVIRLLSDWLTVRYILTDRRREIIDLKRKRREVLPAFVMYQTVLRSCILQRSQIKWTTTVLK